LQHPWAFVGHPSPDLWSEVSQRLELLPSLFLHCIKTGTKGSNNTAYGMRSVLNPFSHIRGVELNHMAKQAHKISEDVEPGAFVLFDVAPVSRGRFSRLFWFNVRPNPKPVWHFLLIDLDIYARRMVMSGARVIMIAAESYKWYGNLIILSCNL
jgi:hypothetical protein